LLSFDLDLDIFSSGRFCGGYGKKSVAVDLENNTDVIFTFWLRRNIELEVADGKVFVSLLGLAL